MRGSWRNEYHGRIVKALLDILILARLEEKSMNGYEITTFLIKKFGVTISTSVVYSTLYSMERSGLVKGDYNRRGRVYGLTEKGNKTLEDARNDIEQIQVFIKKILSKKQNAELKSTPLFIKKKILSYDRIGKKALNALVICHRNLDGRVSSAWRRSGNYFLNYP